MKKIYLPTKFSSKHDIFSSLVAQTVKNLSAVQETLVQPLGPEDSLEKGMTTHASAWRILWTEEAGRLQSTGSKESDMTERLTHICDIFSG